MTTRVGHIGILSALAADHEQTAASARASIKRSTAESAEKVETKAFQEWRRRRELVVTTAERSAKSLRWAISELGAVSRKTTTSGA